MKIAVCDDEKSMLEQMEENLKEFETLFQIDCYTSGEALLDSGIYYDLIFLDIDMKGISAAVHDPKCGPHSRCPEWRHCRTGKPRYFAETGRSVFQTVLLPVPVTHLRQ